MQKAQDNLTAILETVKLYQDGHHFFDIEKLKQAFHEHAYIIGYDFGQLSFDQRDKYIETILPYKPEVIAQTPAPLKILSIDNTDTTAMVKVSSNIGGIQYTSMLSMLKIDSGWKIVNGLYHGEGPA